MKKAELQGGLYQTAYIRGNGEYPIFEVNEAGLTTFYIYSPTGLLCQINNDNEYYIIKDHLGSTRKVVNSEGVVVSSYNYDAFGNSCPVKYEVYFTGMILSLRDSVA